MKELPLVALRAFAIIYQQGGVRAAARELGIAHSSVSRHLAQLEAWLGVRLIRETGSGSRRRVAFTPQGEALGKASLAGLKEIAHAVDGLRESRSAASVVLSTTASFSARWLLPRLPDLERAHPRVELSILVEQRLSDLDKGDVDLAIRMGQGPWPDVDCEPLMDDLLYPVMSPGYWERAGEPKTPTDLVRLRLLHDRDPNASWEAWKRAFGPGKLDVRRGPRLASTDLVMRAAAQGQGVALARHRLAADELAAGTLIRPFGHSCVKLGTAYWIVLPQSSSPKPATRTVVAWLRKKAARALVTP